MISAAVKKKAISRAADSGLSEPWTAFASMDSKIGTNGTWVYFLGIGCAHQSTVGGDRIFTL